VRVPFLRRSRWVNMPKMVAEGWWMVHTTEVPRLAMFFTAVITLSAPNESKPDVGCIVVLLCVAC
jgi:hypothetical protein